MNSFSIHLAIPVGLLGLSASIYLIISQARDTIIGRRSTHTSKD